MRSLTILFALAAVAAAQDQPAFLGVGVDPVDAQLRRNMHVPDDVEGVMITLLLTPSAASRAGLRLGDVIVDFAGEPVRTREGLVELIRAHKPGDRVAYRVRRGTGTIAGQLQLGVQEEGATMTHLRADEEPPPPPGREDEGEPRPDEPGLDRRLDNVEDEIEMLRRRVQARREEARRRERAKRRAPDGLERWIRSEELALVEARQRGAERKVAFHEARLALLREMRGAEVRLPTARVDRLEKKLDEILALLRKKEK
jgi:hypothetical protein